MQKVVLVRRLVMASVAVAVYPYAVCITDHSALSGCGVRAARGRPSGSSENCERARYR